MWTGDLDALRYRVQGFSSVEFLFDEATSTVHAYIVSTRDTVNHLIEVSEAYWA